MILFTDEGIPTWQATGKLNILPTQMLEMLLRYGVLQPDIDRRGADDLDRC